MKLLTFTSVFFFVFASFGIAQNTIPCEEPYPQVNAPIVELTDTSVVLTYSPVEGSTACRIRLTEDQLGSNSRFFLDTLLMDSTYVISGTKLNFQTFYQISISCGCSNDPFVFGEFSFPVWIYTGSTGQFLPCEEPYPAASGLSSQLDDQNMGIQLNWNAIPRSKGCQVIYKTTDGPLNDVFIEGEGINQYFILASNVLTNKVYSWQVRCGCQRDPLIAGEWSALQTFFTGSIGSEDGLAPKSKFTASPKSPVLGSPIEFTDQSFNQPTSWLWDFGDGNTSDLENPVHTYATPGKYSISLTTTNALGEDVRTLEDYIEVFPSLCPNSAVDIDGNEYSVVQIGEACWLAENLRAVRFNNGDSIPYIESITEWLETTSPAYSNYQNDIALGDSAGRLYNGYTILDSRNVCPVGWYVASESDWQYIEALLGMNSFELNADMSSRGDGQNVGGQLKSEVYWSPFNIGAKDSYGLRILPAGSRSFFFFDFIGLQTQARYNVVNDLSEEPPLRYREFSYLSKGINRAAVLPAQGTTLRCVKSDE